MSEGRTSAAQADVEGEDRPVDAPASTGTTGAGDVSGSGGTDGHGTNGTTSSESAPSETASSETTGETTSDTSTESTSETSSEASSDATTGTTSSDAAPEEEAGTAETVPAATLPGEESTTSSSPAAASGTAGDEEWADAEDKAYKREMRKGFAFGAAGGIVVGAIVALLLGALVWPGYLLGPGDPQDTANQVTQALSSKDAGALDGLSCKGPNGQPVTQLSPQVLQFITKVAPAGPTSTLIDTEARTPVDLTLSVQGQTQTLPSELVLGETKGDWCLKGLAQRQQ